MSDQQELIKLKRITIKTESGSRWFDAPHKSTAWQLLTQAQRWSSLKNSRLESLNAVRNQNFQAGPLKLQILLGLPGVMPIKTAKRQRSHTAGHIAEKNVPKKT